MYEAKYHNRWVIRKEREGDESAAGIDLSYTEDDSRRWRVDGTVVKFRLCWNLMPQTASHAAVEILLVSWRVLTSLACSHVLAAIHAAAVTTRAMSAAYS